MALDAKLLKGELGEALHSSCFSILGLVQSSANFTCEQLPAAEFYLPHIKDPEIVQELRQRGGALAGVLPATTHTLQLFITPQTLESAGRMFEIALDVMTR